MKEIRQIIQFYDRFKASGLRLALASVVSIEHSSYRRIGARMIVCDNGEWTGGISGGCLEGDALRRSQKAIHRKVSSRIIYDTLEDDENQIGVGLGCNGKIEVLFSPIDITDMHNELEQLRVIVDNNVPAILLKCINAHDNIMIGATKVIEEELSDDLILNIPPIKIWDAISAVRLSRRPQVVRLKAGQNQETELLVEYLRPETRLVIVGDNYDVMAMVGVANEQGWQIHIVGRSRKLSKALFKKCKSIHDYENISQVPIDEFTAVVLMTHDYNWDKKLLPYILDQNPPYVGMLGPKKRVEKMDLELKNIALAEIDIFHSPVGLDIGAESPEEIALSIAAEIVAVMRQRKGSKLKFREGAIHHRKTHVHVIG